MNNLIFYVLLELLFESEKRNYTLEAFIKTEFVIKFHTVPTYTALRDFYQKLNLSGHYDNLPWEADDQKKKGS